jgi:hypothetical protein
MLHGSSIKDGETRARYLIAVFLEYAGLASSLEKTDMLRCDGTLNWARHRLRNFRTCHDYPAGPINREMRHHIE